MALLRTTLRSETLEMDTHINFIVPYDTLRVDFHPPIDNTLILLHGLKQNADAWIRMSRVELYAHMLGFNIILPEVQRSWYANQPYGLRYFDYISQELPQIASQLLHLPTDPAHLYVGGLSMGGYGAMKCVLTYPEKFAGAMCLSGAVRLLEDITVFPPDVLNYDELRATLGLDLKCAPENNLMLLAEKAALSPSCPRLYVACGYDDFLIKTNREFHNHLEKLHMDIMYEEWPGIHDWAFWDRALGRGMAYFHGDPMDLFEKGMETPTN